MSARAPFARILSAALLLSGLPNLLLAQPAEAPLAPPVAPPEVIKPPADLPPATEAQMEAQMHVMAGELAAGRGQPKEAAEEFLKALELQPDVDLAERATKLALGARDLDLALNTARRWLAMDSTALEAREIIARLALRKGDIEETYTQSLEIVKGHAGGPGEGFRHVALLLAGEPDAGEAVQSLLARLVGQYPKEAGAHYAMALAALRYDNLVQAEASAREALKLEPDSADYGLLMVGVLSRKGELEESDKLMSRLLKKSKDREELRMAYVKLLLEARQRDHARAQLQAALKANPKHEDAAYALGVLALNDGEFDQARKLFEPLAKDPDRGMDASYQLGRVAEAQKRYPDALAHYESVTSGGQALDAVLRKAAVLGRLDRLDEGRDVLHQLRAQFPPLAPRLILAEGEMLVEIAAYDEALAVYSKALAEDPDNEDLLYGRSLAHEKAKRIDLAEKDLRTILADAPDSERAMNALGYMLVVHTKRYEEARNLIARALELAPEDPAVIDSMGWVQFKLGDVAAARGFLEKAYDQAQDPEIAAHLGEVLWTLGEKDRARAVWDKALAAQPDHEVLKDTVKRLSP